MPRQLKKTLKYKCLEILCSTTHRQDKWVEHCKNKHYFKFKNNLAIKYKVVEFKEGSGEWKPYPDPKEVVEWTQLPLPPQENEGHKDDKELTLSEKEGSITERLCSQGTGCPHSSSTFLNEQVKTKKSHAHDVDLNSIQSYNDTISERPGYSLNASMVKRYEIELSPKLQVPESGNSLTVSPQLADISHQPEPENSRNQDNVFKSITDPAFFANKKLSPENINLALQLENQDLGSMIFPAKGGRKFNPFWKTVSLPNKKGAGLRKWLVYSQEKDAVFCLYCLLFALPTERSNWGTTGYRGWLDHRGERGVYQHEMSQQHISANIARIQWMSHERVDKSLAQQSDTVVHHNREVLSVIIDCCRFLSEEMLGFRNKKVMKGKLLGLFKVIGKYSPHARVYLDKIDKARSEKVKLGSNLLSYRNVYDLINIMSELVVSTITKNINMTNVYAIIVDSTQDVSKKECSTVLIRHIEQVDAQGNPKPDIKPQERLVKVFTTGDTTGENLSKEIMSCLGALGIDFNGMVGQSMDGASNMKGKYKGVKSCIQKVCPKAFYIWCCSHRFALVVEKSLEMCPQMRNLFSLLEELYVFMSGHKRHHIFSDNLKKGNTSLRKKRLKRVQTTRWSSRNDALLTVESCFETIIQTLLQFSLDKNCDSETKATASGLMKQMLDFDNVCTMYIALRVFKILAPISVCLQSKSLDYSIAPKIIKEAKEKLSKLRTECEWEMLKTDITAFVDENNVAQPNRRSRKRKRLMDEIAVDERIEEPFKKIKVEVYFQVLDSLYSQLRDRFPDDTLALVSQMAVFSHEGILKLAKDQESGFDLRDVPIQELCDFYDLERELVVNELYIFLRVYKVTHSNINISDMLTEKKSQEHKSTTEKTTYQVESDFVTSDDQTDQEDNIDIDLATNQWVKRGFIRPYRCIINLSGLPNLTMLYTILLSLPVTSCSAERTMSRLKIVKNRLRSSIGDEWLSSLLILACESDVLEQISNEDIIDKFAVSSERRKKILCRKSYVPQK